MNNEAYARSVSCTITFAVHPRLNLYWMGRQNMSQGAGAASLGWSLRAVMKGAAVTRTVFRQLMAGISVNADQTRRSFRDQACASETPSVREQRGGGSAIKRL